MPTGGTETSQGGKSNAAGGAGSASGGRSITGSGGVDVTNPPVTPGTPVDSVSADAAPVVGTFRDITPKTINADDNPCTDIAFDPSDHAKLYAVYGDGGGLWRSADSGKTWSQFGNLPMPNGMGRIRVDPKDPKHLYATSGVGGDPQNWGLWISNDGGETWVMPGAFSAGASSGKWSNDIYNIVTDPKDFNHFIMSSHRGWNCCGDDAGVLESTDGGKTFIAHQPPAGMNHGNGIAILYDEATKQGDVSTWLVGGGYVPGLFRTTDAGENWSTVDSEAQDNHGGFFASYSTQGYLYIGVSGGLLRSTDNGKTWTKESDGLGGWFYGAVSDGHQLFTATAYVGVAYNEPLLVSPEGGANEGSSWKHYSDQTIANGPFRMVFDADNRIIYGANWASGAMALNVGD